MKKDKTNNILLLMFAYALAIFLSFAILRYLMVFEWTKNPSNQIDTLVRTRIFLSGPGLATIGIFLFLTQKGINKIIGSLLIAGGITWIIMIVQSIGQEAG